MVCGLREYPASYSVIIASMNYVLPSTEEIAKFAPDLLPCVIKDQDKFWFVKYKPGTRDQEKRDLLAYLLGKDICNVSEIKLLSDSEHAEIKTKLNLDQGSNKNNTFLVRLAGSYSLSELPNQTLEAAVATELVYSIWIRRRDTHSLNRVYLDGIPIFFDHETAFLADPQWAHSTMFFRNNLDYGHPGYWRVKTISSSEKMETIQARNTHNINNRAHHYVYNLEDFKKEIVKAEESVKNLASSDLKQTIIQAGFNQAEAESIDNFLKNNLVTLSNDIAQMKEIIFLP
mgnify:CR=1 FL=1